MGGMPPRADSTCSLLTERDPRDELKGSSFSFVLVRIATSERLWFSWLMRSGTSTCQENRYIEVEATVDWVWARGEEEISHSPFTPYAPLCP